jgi:uncharacterized membrane protein YhaH (DUF805 family)
MNMEYLSGIIITIIIYGAVIKRVDSGRCFQYEYIVKTLIIIGLYIICFALIFIHFFYFSINAFILLCFFAFPVLMYKSLKYTIQRFYDLDLSGLYILLKLLPIFSIFLTFYLYFKKGNCGINGYDKAINYKKIFKHMRFIDIYDKIFFIDNEEYQYERYLGKYTIKLSKYGDTNFFIEYLSKNYQVNDTDISKTVEIASDEFNDMIKDLNLTVIEKSFYINILEFKIFIRKENFKYTIILDKNINKISKELFEKFDFPGSFFEDDDYVYYRRLYKEDILKWINNFA